MSPKNTHYGRSKEGQSPATKEDGEGHENYDPKPGPLWDDRSGQQKCTYMYTGDLRKVTDAWGDLPEVIRSAIMGMVMRVAQPPWGITSIHTPLSVSTHPDDMALVRTMRNRKWTTLWFGKHACKTLPHVIIIDPGYFYWAVWENMFKGKQGLREDAELLSWIARKIIIPPWYRKDGIAAWHFRDGLFTDLQIVPPDYKPPRSRILFSPPGRRIRVTGKTCEEFFRDATKFSAY